ncbi:ATP-binding protein [Arcanobacterium haemolyticum]|uniref:ATP-binding protein n=1 Tax=Arcanobacterium haemolyticum TaxID=28264 RepID=UPI000DE59291|nr:ATP-binding protein [Arcanobacterium haemolyticum]
MTDGLGAHERISLVTGPKGIGKTVILNEFEQVALNEGWTVFSETATPGFTDRLTRTILRKLDTDTRLTGINFSMLGASFGAQWTGQTYKEPTFHEVTSLLLDALVEVSHKINQEPTGILITLDELHHLQADDIIQFSSTIQHLVREDRQIAVVMAGIPTQLSCCWQKEGERTLLLSLGAQNDGPSQTKAIAQGLDQTPQYANTYRNRLIEAQMIYTPRI